MYNDKLILWNEGRLPDGFTVQTLLEKHPSRPYNKTVAEIFFKAGFIEAWGRGISKIITGFKRAKLPIPDFEAKMGGIVVTVYRKTRGNDGLNNGLNDGLNDGLNERQKKVLKEIKSTPGIKGKELSEHLNIPIDTIDRYIKLFTSKNLVERKGSKKTGGYYVK